MSALQIRPFIALAGTPHRTLRPSQHQLQRLAQSTHKFAGGQLAALEQLPSARLIMHELIHAGSCRSGANQNSDAINHQCLSADTDWVLDECHEWMHRQRHLQRHQLRHIKLQIAWMHPAPHQPEALQDAAL